MPPYKHAFCDYCMNNQASEDKEIEFAKLVPESGFTYFQMALPFLDKQKGAYVDFDKINEPVLVITGTDDRMVNPNIAKATAKKYKNAKKFKECFLWFIFTLQKLFFLDKSKDFFLDFWLHFMMNNCFTSAYFGNLLLI